MLAPPETAVRVGAIVGFETPFFQSLIKQHYSGPETFSSLGFSLAGIAKIINRHPRSGLELLFRHGRQAGEFERFLLADQIALAYIQNNRLNDAENALEVGETLAYRRWDRLRLVQRWADLYLLLGRPREGIEILENYESAMPFGDPYRDAQLQKDFAHLELCRGNVEFAASHLARAFDADTFSRGCWPFSLRSARLRMDEAYYEFLRGDLVSARAFAETAVDQICGHLQPAALLDAFVLLPLLCRNEPAIGLRTINGVIKRLKPSGDDTYEAFVAPARGALEAMKAAVLSQRADYFNALLQGKIAFKLARRGSNAIAFNRVVDVFREVLEAGPLAHAAGAAAYFRQGFEGLSPASYVWRNNYLWN
jgi:hypothetical protein